MGAVGSKGLGSKGPGGLGRRVSRFFLFFLGPAQLGRTDEPAPDPNRVAPDPPCSLCGTPTSAHSFVRRVEKTEMRCPR